MNQLKKYLQKNNIEYCPNCGGGINIDIPTENEKRLEKYIKKLNLKYVKRYGWNYATTIISVF